MLLEARPRELALSCRVQLGLLLVAVPTMYLPVLVSSYGFADDYLFLYDLKHGGGGQVASVNLSNGRPLTYLADLLGFGLVPDVGSLWWLRLVGVLGVAGVAAVVLVALVVSGRPRWVAFWAALAVASLPAFQVVAGWATLFAVPAAMLLAMVAAWLTHVRAVRGAVSSAATAVAALLLTGAVLTYQPAAMAYWLVLAVFLTGRGRLRRMDARIAWMHARPLLLAAVPAAVAWWAGRAQQTVPGRSSLATNPLALAGWFGRRVLPRAVAPFSLDPGRVTALLCAAAALAGLWLATRRPGRLALVLALLPLAYAPILAVGGDIAPTTRTLIALEPVALVLLLHAGEGFAAALAGAGLAARVVPRLAAALPVFLVAQAAIVPLVYVARPQAIEWRAAVAAVADVPGDARITVARADVNASPAGRWLYDELGVPSTWYSWDLRPVVSLAYRHGTGRWPAGVVEVDRGTPGAVDFGPLLRAAN